MTCSWRWFIHPETAISKNRNGSSTLCVFKTHYRDRWAAVAKYRIFMKIQFSDHTPAHASLLERNRRLKERRARLLAIDERETLRTKLRPALRSVGLPTGTGWHCFRRLHCSLLQQAGASGLETAKLIGHVNTGVTQNYTIVAPVREAELVAGVQRLLLA